MAVKIERGGWILIFLLGLGLVGYSLNKYGLLNVGKLIPGSKSSSSAKVDPAKPLDTSVSGETGNVRVRLNIWVGCVGGLVANGGLDTVPGSIFADKGLNVTFKIIDDWTEGSAALASNNVDIMLTTADVWGKDFGQFQEKGVNAHAFFMVDWSRGADGIIGAQGIRSIEDLAGKTIAFAPYTPSHFLLWNGLKSSGLSTEQQNEIFNKAVHTGSGSASSPTASRRSRRPEGPTASSRPPCLRSRRWTPPSRGIPTCPTPSPSVPARTKSTTRAWPTA